MGGILRSFWDDFFDENLRQIGIILEWISEAFEWNLEEFQRVKREENQRKTKGTPKENQRKTKGQQKENQGKTT